MHAIGTFLDGSASILLQMGLPGLIIGFLGLAYYRKDQAYCAVMEKRVVEASASTTALVQSSAAMQRFADALIQGQPHHSE